MAYENLKSAIKQAIKQNGNQEITGNLLQSTLLSMVDNIPEIAKESGEDENKVMSQKAITDKAYTRIAEIMMHGYDKITIEKYNGKSIKITFPFGTNIRFNNTYYQVPSSNLILDFKNEYSKGYLLAVFNIDTKAISLLTYDSKLGVNEYILFSLNIYYGTNLQSKWVNYIGFPDSIQDVSKAEFNKAYTRIAEIMMFGDAKITIEKYNGKSIKITFPFGTNIRFNNTYYQVPSSNLILDFKNEQGRGYLLAVFNIDTKAINLLPYNGELGVNEYILFSLNTDYGTNLQSKWVNYIGFPDSIQDVSKAEFNKAYTRIAEIMMFGDAKITIEKYNGKSIKITFPFGTNIRFNNTYYQVPSSNLILDFKNEYSKGYLLAVFNIDTKAINLLPYNGELGVNEYILFSLNTDYGTNLQSKWVNYIGFPDSIQDVSKAEFNKAIKTLYSIGSPYSNNNIGWTSQTGIEPASDSFIVTHLSFTTHRNIEENFNSTLRVAIVTLSDDWSTIVEVNEITDDLNLVNLKNSTFYQVEVEGITIQKNQILCAKGLGFDISNKETIGDTIFFAADSDIEAGKPVSKYYMNSPFFYVSTQESIRKLQKATASNINKNVKLMVFGDSITDTEVSGMGDLINSLLNTTLIQNFARGNATLSDYSNDYGENITQISLEKQKNEAVNTNVLSNQVRRAIQYTSALNSKLTWNHPIYGEYSIDETYGKGLGHVSDIPDIIYIALGTNDTKTSMLNNMLNDNYEQLYSQKYNNVNTTNIFGALLWAVETLRCVYPKAQIFIETPLQTKRLWGSNQNLCNDRIFKARNIIIKAANFLSCHVIDSYAESGFNELIAQNVNDGIHPTGMWKQLIGQYIAKQIKNNYFHK